MQHQGIDIASYQHPGGAPIDYQAAVDDLRRRGGGAQPFVMVKITEGTSYINPYWQADVTGFANAGAAVAGYIFDHGRTDPAAEETFARHVVGPGLPLVCDGETPEGLTAAQYRDHMAQVIGQEPVKVEYLNQSQLAAGELSPWIWLWLAEYDGGPPKGEKLRQITSTGSVAGILGGAAIDFDIWTGTEDEFNTLFHIGPIPGGNPLAANPLPPSAYPIKDFKFQWSPTEFEFDWAFLGADGHVYHLWYLKGPMEWHGPEIVDQL